MEITLDKHSANQATIKIKLIEADYQPKVDSKLKDYTKKAVIRGFRPGKAPFSMVKSMYGTSILVEEINNLLGDSLNSYLKKQTFKILGDPIPEESKENSIDWKTQKEFEFEYKIGFVEPFQLDLDKTISGTKFSLLVDEKLVNETIDKLKVEYGEILNPEVSESGDILFGEFSSASGDVKKNLSIDTSKLSKKLAGKLSGIAKDSLIEFEAKEVKKDDWSEIFKLSEEQLKNEKVLFTFAVRDVERITPAELNQDFFDKIFGPGQVTSLEDFKNKVKQTLQDSYDGESKSYTEEELKKLITERVNISLPESFLKEWLLRINEGKVSEDDVEREFPIYAKQLTWSLISNQIASQNGIKSEYEDVVEKTKQILRKQFASSGLGSQIESSMDIFVDNYLRGNDGQNYSKVSSTVLDEKVLTWIMEKINLTEKNVSVDEFKELLSK